MDTESCTSPSRRPPTSTISPSWFIDTSSTRAGLPNPKSAAPYAPNRGLAATFAMREKGICITRAIADPSAVPASGAASISATAA
ncbi:Os08g0174000 [Oryza sativa Japonica Group]|uniref:Os08g0174000 protein n=2 Tax=Oryza sativa subsp. japonica TaxID=39947 RepID=Q0J7P6_ORYSJ|nr:Os08g0174000 [Oryza sativa Japonica Group]BAT04045.1 Os08g0174000 [Oryza sativa Japonica Group]|eukprot:NP_001061105.1 Os08g0174000 [Oryza sativa Japonica Group]